MFDVLPVKTSFDSHLHSKLGVRKIKDMRFLVKVIVMIENRASIREKVNEASITTSMATSSIEFGGVII